MTGADTRERIGRVGGEALALGVFAAIQTFLFFALRDRFAVLFWWSPESWLYVSLLWLKNLALAGAAYFAFVWLSRRTASLPVEEGGTSSGSRVRHALLFLAIVGVGIALRWIAPRQIPPGVWVDPLVEVHQILRHPGESGWLGGWPRDGEGSQSTEVVSSLYLLFCELLFQVFGRGDVGILALSAVGGCLTLPALYFLAREIEGPRVALVATAIMAFSAWALVFSRWTWRGALTIFLVTCASAATLVALRKQSVRWSLAAGVFVGLSLHTHTSAYPAAVGFALFGLWSLKKPQVRKLTGAAALGALLAFAPLGVAFLQYPERIGGRARDASFLNRWTDATVPGAGTAFGLPAVLLHNSLQYTGLFLWTADPNPRHGLPNRPRVGFLIGVAGLVGAGVALKRARQGDDRHVLLLLVAGTSLLAGILSDPTGAPNSFRAGVLIVPLTIWAAATLGAWASAVARGLRVHESLLWTLGLCCLLVSETDNALRRWPEDPRVRASFAPAESSAGAILRDLASGPTVLDPGAVWRPIVTETLSGSPDFRLPVRRLARWSSAYLAANPPANPFWYVTTPDGLDTLQRNGWRCARGVPIVVDGPQVVIARVVPPGREGRAPSGRSR